MRKVLMMAVVVITFAGCENKIKKPDQAPGGWDVTIRGKVGFPKNGKIEISELRSSGASPFTDSIELDMEKYSFEKTLHIYEPGYYQINFYNIQTVDFILHDTDIEVNVDGNDPTGFSEVKGSPDHDLISKVQTYMRDAMQSSEFTKLEAEFQQAGQAGNTERVLELQEEYIALTKKAHDSVVVILSKAEPSIGLMNILQSSLLDYDKDFYFDFYKSSAEKLSAAWPNSLIVKDFAEMVQKMSIITLGAVAPEISLPDKDGRIVTLSSLKGKYVLVDFWAKWCGPCRRENPNLVKAYKKFKGEAFEILGVSLDRNREDWLQAIKEDGLTWTQVSDLRYMDSQAALDYNINAIPFSILVDPSGVIIAKSLRGSALDKKLSEIFKKS